MDACGCIRSRTRGFLYPRIRMTRSHGWGRIRVDVVGPRVSRGYWTGTRMCIEQYYSNIITVSSPSLLCVRLPDFVLELFFSKLDMMSALGISPGTFIHALRIVAARVDSSERLCRSLDTVKPPLEKPRSTSTDVANYIEILGRLIE